MNSTLWFNLLLSALIVFGAIYPNQALSADLCNAIAVRDVAAIENPDSILQKGKYDEAVTQYRLNKQTGATMFCSHGGYCYPTYVIIDEEKVEALRLVNCKIGERNYEDNEEITYSVDVIRSKNSAAQLKLDDLDNRLRDLGLCNACANNVAVLYIKNPDSTCGKLTKLALEGDPIATQQLRANPAYCKDY